jgi:hypothetical protein
MAAPSGLVTPDRSKDKRERGGRGSGELRAMVNLRNSLNANNNRRTENAVGAPAGRAGRISVLLQVHRWVAEGLTGRGRAGNRAGMSANRVQIAAA